MRLLRKRVNLDEEDCRKAAALDQKVRRWLLLRKCFLVELIHWFDQNLQNSDAGSNFGTGNQTLNGAGPSLNVTSCAQIGKDE